MPPDARQARDCRGRRVTQEIRLKYRRVVLIDANILIYGSMRMSVHLFSTIPHAIGSISN